MLELLGFTEPDDAPFIIDVPYDSPVVLLPDPQPTPMKKRRTAPVPRLADVRTTESTENTGVLVARLWQATDAEEPLGEDWTPAADITTPRRSFRWSFLITAAVVLAAIAGVVVFTSQWPARQATELRHTLASGLAGLEAESPGVDTVRTIITDVEATSSDLTDVAIPLLGFSGAADTAYRAATADPGLELPLVPNAPVEALTPVKAELLRAADLAFDIHDQVGDVLDYRVLLDKAFVLPATLPVEAGDERISEIGVELSDTLAATTDVLLRLPQNDLLADHRFQVESALADMNATVAAYLAALREQDGARASELAAHLRTTTTDIRTSLSTTLDRVDVWMVEALDRLNGQLTTTRTAFQASA